MGIVLVGSYPLSADCIRGGVESSVYGLAQTLVARKHVVDVFDYPRLKGSDKSERNDLLTIHRYANNGTYNQDATQRAKEIFRDIVALHPNIVHLHGTGELSLLLYQAINKYGIPVILTVHGLLHEEKKNVLRKHPSLKHLYQYIHQSKVEFKVLSLASRIIVDTKYVADKINEYYTKGKISHLPTILLRSITRIRNLQRIFFLLGLFLSEKGICIWSMHLRRCVSKFLMHNWL